jgi:hypothetical protein
MEDAGVCASGRALPFCTVIHRIVDQSISAKRRERLVPEKTAQMASGFCPGGVPQISVRARWLKTLSSCLTHGVAEQFIVEWLVANLLDRPQKSMLFHAGD